MFRTVQGVQEIKMKHTLTPLRTILFSALLLGGCPTPFTYNITKSTLEAGIRAESFDKALNATKKDGQIVLHYIATVTSPPSEEPKYRFERLFNTEPRWNEDRWAVWDIEELRIAQTPSPITIRHEAPSVGGEAEPFIPIEQAMLDSLEDRQRERLLMVRHGDLYWVGSGKIQKLTGFDKPKHREHWGYFAQAALPFAFIGDIITYPFQLFNGFQQCTASVTVMGRDRRCHR